MNWLRGERKGMVSAGLLLLLGTGLAWAAAVWGPWVPAEPAALQVLGVDMAEVVKFLPGVRSGDIAVWREGFLLPQVILSLFLSVHAWQRRWPWPWPWRLGMQALAFMVALSMLPPAWTPATLRAPEWQTQVRLILFCALMAGMAPLWRWLPSWLGDGLLALGGIGTGLWLVAALQRVWPQFEMVYNTPLPYGWGLWALGVGITGLLILAGEHVRR